MFHYSKGDLKDILYDTLFQTLFLVLNFNTKNKKLLSFSRAEKVELSGRWSGECCKHLFVEFISKLTREPLTQMTYWKFKAVSQAWLLHSNMKHSHNLQPTGLGL